MNCTAPGSPTAHKATSPMSFPTTLCLAHPTPVTLTFLLFFKHTTLNIICVHRFNILSMPKLNLFIHLPTASLIQPYGIHTLSIRHLKVDVPMPTQIRHCKKELSSHHRARCLEVAANLHCTSPHNQWVAQSCHISQHRSLSLPFPLPPSIQSLCLFWSSHVWNPTPPPFVP